VVVAVVPVRVVQVAVDEIVDVIAMRHGLMPATGAVLMPRFVSLATMLGRAAIRVLRRHLDGVLIDVVAVHMVQVPIVQIVDMIAMTYRRVAAVGAVLMRVIGVMWFLARRHGGLPAGAVWAPGYVASCAMAIRNFGNDCNAAIDRLSSA
jgi:hypothetical protein